MQHQYDSVWVIKIKWHQWIFLFRVHLNQHVSSLWQFFKASIHFLNGSSIYGLLGDGVYSCWFWDDDEVHDRSSEHEWIAKQVQHFLKFNGNTSNNKIRYKYEGESGEVHNLFWSAVHSYNSPRNSGDLYVLLQEQPSKLIHHKCELKRKIHQTNHSLYHRRKLFVITRVKIG